MEHFVSFLGKSPTHQTSLYNDTITQTFERYLHFLYHLFISNLWLISPINTKNETQNPKNDTGADFERFHQFFSNI
jgi:hypothetical protein